MQTSRKNFYLGIDWEDFGLIFFDQGKLDNHFTYESDFNNETLYLLKTLKEVNIKCTFFANARTAEKYPELLLLIKNDGHSIESHGYKHIPREKMSNDEFYNDCLKSKNIIENIIEQKVTGYRSPLLSISRNNYIESLNILKDAGYKYDSSITKSKLDNIIKNLKNDWRNFYPPIKVIPLCSFENKYFSFNIAGGSIWRLFPATLLSKILTSKFTPKSSSLYLHPYEFGSPININRALSKNSSILKKLGTYYRWNFNKRAIEITLTKLSNNKKIIFKNIK